MAPKEYNTGQNAMKERATAAKEQKKKKTASKEKIGKNDPSIVSKNTVMDPKLWGTLQLQIDLLENVYCRLPLEDFFELRAVCKAWYDVACKRMALKESIHKPFFTLYTQGGRSYRLEGILTYNKASKSKSVRRSKPSALGYNEPSQSMPLFMYKPSWGWKRRGDANDLCGSICQIVATEGLVCNLSAYTPYCCNYPSVTVQDWNCPNEKYPFPRSWDSTARSRSASIFPRYGPEHTVMGMIVLPKEKHPFNVVLGSLEHDTRVYDSESHSWEMKPCRPNVRGDMHQTTGCAARNGRVYITMEFTREILVFDFKKASWSSIDAPGGSANSTLSTQPQHYCNDTLGAWNGHLLDVVDDEESSSLSVWELIDEAKQEWRVFDRMPTDLYSFWLRFKDGPDHINPADITIHASFCGDYMLVYSWVFKYEWARRYCLYNLATKLWQKLGANGKNTLMKTVYIKRRHGSDKWNG